MAHKKLTASVKTRVEVGVSRGLRQVARERHLNVSDIAREALREYLERHSLPQAPVTTETAVAA